MRKLKKPVSLIMASKSLPILEIKNTCPLCGSVMLWESMNDSRMVLSDFTQHHRFKCSNVTHTFEIVIRTKEDLTQSVESANDSKDS